MISCYLGRKKQRENGIYKMTIENISTKKAEKNENIYDECWTYERVTSGGGEVVEEGGC